MTTRFLNLILITTVFISHAYTQEKTLAVQKGGWYPAPVKLQQYQSGKFYGFTVIQQQAAYQKMTAFMEVFHQFPFVATPHGYEIAVYASLCADGCVQQKPVAGLSGLLLREWYTRGTGPLQKAEEGPSVNVYFNDLRPLLRSTPGPDDRYFEAPEFINTVEGFSVYAGGYIVITKRMKPLFTPVSEETFITQSIQQLEKNLAATKQLAGKGSAYQQWLHDKAGNEKAFMEGNEWLKKSDPVKAKASREQFLAGMLETERVLQAAEKDNLLEQQSMIEQQLTAIREKKEKLAKMSATERRQTARSLRGLPLVQWNPLFYDAGMPVTNLQVAIIDLFRYPITDDTRDLGEQGILQLRKEVVLKDFLQFLQ